MERSHGTAQDRLIKKLRLKGIRDHAAVNAYLERDYYPGQNARFARTPAAEEDFHLPVPRGLALDDVFRLEFEHTLGRDWVVRHDNRFFQVHRQSRYAPARSQVLVCESEDGRVTIEYRGQQLGFEEIAPPRPPVSAVLPRIAKPQKSCGRRRSIPGAWATTRCRIGRRGEGRPSPAVEMAAAWTLQERAPTPLWKSRAEREIPTFPHAHHHQPRQGTFLSREGRGHFYRALTHVGPHP